MKEMSVRVSRALTGRASRAEADYVDEDYEGPELIARRMRLVVPNGPRKVLWDWLIIVLVLYNAYMIPFDLAFDLCLGAGLLAVDILVDALFIFDVFLSFRTTYYDRTDGALVLDYALVRKNYLKTWFAIDFIASVPIEYVAFAAVGRSPLECSMGGSVSGAVQTATLLKIARLLRLGRLIKKFEKLAAAKAFRVIQLTITLLFAAHWFACVWFAVGKTGVEHEDALLGLPGTNGSTWIHRLQISDEPFGVQYFISFYWALTMVMKSPWLAPASMTEFALASCMALVGSVIFAYFVGNVTAVITSSTQQANKYRDALGSLRTFSRAHNLPVDTTRKLLAYYDALWVERHGDFDTQQILAKVPTHLLPKLLVELYAPLLQYAPFLSELSLSCCASLLAALRVDVCDTNDELIRAGTFANSMYILWRGEMQLTFPPGQAAGEVLTVSKFVAAVAAAQLRKASAQENAAECEREREAPGGKGGSNSKRGATGRLDRPGTLIGFENVFAAHAPMDYSARAKIRCTLFAITRDELKKVLTEFPEDFEIVHKAINHSNSIIRGRRTFPNSGGSLPSTRSSNNLAEAEANGEGPRPSLSPQVDHSDAVGPPSPASFGSSHASLASKVERLERSVAQISEAMAMQSKAISEQCLLLQAVLQKAGQHNGGSQQAPVRVAPTEIEVTM